MVEVICLFFPAFLSFNLEDDELSLFLKIKKYINYNILINFLTMMIVYLKSDFRNLEVKKMFTISVFPKYLLLASLIALFLPRFLSFVKSNFKIRIRRVKVRKRAEKSN
ncbi:MAG: hypothetical protein IKG27_03160 [Bacilli bacterium]|nr:hypothetical protein [Bacilli bacterium]